MARKGVDDVADPHQDGVGSASFSTTDTNSQMPTNVTMPTKAERLYVNKMAATKTALANKASSGNVSSHTHTTLIDTLNKNASMYWTDKEPKELNRLMNVLAPEEMT